MIKNTQYKTGYTLIETMISVSLFLVIAVLGMGTFINANVLYQKSEDTRSIMDSVNFIIEDMSRNLRTGYDYRCVTDGNYTSSNVPQSCTIGGGIIFEEAHGSPTNNGDQWMYKIEGAASNINIYRSTNGGASWVQLNPPEVTFDSFSGFKVIGAEAPTGVWSGNLEQPFVTIRLSGKVTYKNIVTPFALQTSVSQRVIDVP